MRTGVDIVDVRRIESILSKKQDSFYKKIFTSGEIGYINKTNNNSKTIAGLFAAKEAVSKLLGRGIGSIGWHDIEILHDNNGRPFININTKIKNYLQDLGLAAIDISISHEKDYAISFAIGF